jgi:peptidoglycan/LPS O-acetylase OafA/YrhL
MRFLGKYSYGLYVFHHFFSYYFLTHDTEGALTERLGSHTLAVTVLALAGSAASIAVSMASFRFFEQPFLSLKRYFPSASGAPHAPVTPVTEGAGALAVAGSAAAHGDAAALAAVPDSPSSAQ